MEIPSPMMSEGNDNKLKDVRPVFVRGYYLINSDGFLIPLTEVTGVRFQLAELSEYTDPIVFHSKEKPSNSTADQEGQAADPHARKWYPSFMNYDEDPRVFQLKGNSAFAADYDHPYLGKYGEDGVPGIHPRVFQLKGNSAFPGNYDDPYAKKPYESLGKYGEDNLPGIHAPPHTCIDMPKENVIPLIVQQNWHDYMQVKKNQDAIWDKSAIVQATLGITVQAIGTMLANAFTDPTVPSWAKYLVKATTVGGLGATVAGMGLSRFKGVLPTVMIKTGAIATASAIIVSLGVPLEPVVAWTVGPASLLLVGTAVILA